MGRECLGTIIERLECGVEADGLFYRVPTVFEVGRRKLELFQKYACSVANVCGGDLGED